MEVLSRDAARARLTVLALQPRSQETIAERSRRGEKVAQSLLFPTVRPFRY